MIVPTYLQEKIVDESGYPTAAFSDFLRVLLQNMQLSISNEGYLIPSVTKEDMIDIQASFKSNVVNPNNQTVSIGVQIGTLVFNTETVNGGGVKPRGQLYILLNDGIFHAVINL